MESSAVIYGPPGCGKSTEIIRRMNQAMKNGTPKDKIGLVSFTRAAANELAKRAGVPPGKNIATIHSYSFRICDMIREQVIDRAKLREFSKASGIETTGASIYDEEQLGDGDRYLAAYGYMRSTLITDDAEAFKVCGAEGSLAVFRYFIKAYEQWKQAHGYMDFGDMLEHALDRPAPDLDILFLDEAQDFSPAQWKLIETWVPHIPEIVLALDDDQTLYKFTGADPDGGPSFERRHKSERVILDQSYRVPRNIHTLAEKVIRRVSSRVEKDYLPVADGGDIRRFGNIRTVDKLSPSEETLVLFRNHSLRDEIETWLIDSGTPYITDGGRQGPMQGALAATIRSWETAAENYEHMGQALMDTRSMGLFKKMAKPIHRRAFESGKWEHLLDRPWTHIFRAPPHLLAFFDRVRKQYGTYLPATLIHLSTIHGSKGREADRVILVDGMSYRTAESYTKDPDPEIRAFYVGITRAKKRLDIVAGDNQTGLLK